MITVNVGCSREGGQLQVGEGPPVRSFTTATLGYVNWAGGEVEEWLLVLRAWKKNFELIAFGLVPLSFGLVLFFLPLGAGAPSAA